MHIGFCSPLWPPATAANGIVTYVASARDYLLSQGHQVSVIAQGRLIDSGGQEHDLHVDDGMPGQINEIWTRLRRRVERGRGDLPSLGRFVAAQVAAAHRLASIDLLEMEESFGWSDIVRRASIVPVVTRLHGPSFMSPEIPRTPDEARAFQQRCEAEGRAVRGAASLTAPTRHTLYAACARYRRASHRPSLVIPNPIAMAAPERRWQLDTCDRDHILMVGRFDRLKGADTMLLAFDSLLARRPSARLTLVGPESGIPERSGRILTFADYIAAHLSPRAREQVHFTGRLSPGAIEQLRREAFVTVIPSRAEVFSYTLLEAFSIGCPIISTDWPGADEIIRSGENGLLTPVGDIEALAGQLDWLMDHPDAAARIAESGHRHCRDHFSGAAVGSKMVDWYQATLAETSR